MTTPSGGAARVAALLPEGELELVRAAQLGPGEARDELVRAFTPMVASVARRYRGAVAVDRRELLQEGVVGLLRALERFDSVQGTPFWAYATWWVRQAMQRLVAELGRPVVLPDRAARQLARVKDTRRTFLERHGREPTPSELARDAGLSREQVDALIAVDREPRALDAVSAGDDPERTIDRLRDPDADEPYALVHRRLARIELEPLLATLGDSEAAVIRGRYGLSGPQESRRALAERLGVRVERVRQLEERALWKLRIACGSAPNARARAPTATRPKTPDARPTLSFQEGSPWSPMSLASRCSRRPSS
jgi:RNA polymerase primary sigma factor